MAITVRYYQQTDKNLWDELIRHSPQGRFLFFRDYMEYHHERFSDASLLVFRGDELRMALPANQTEPDKVLHSHQGLSYGGSIFHQAVKYEEMAYLFQALFQFLIREGFEMLNYKALPAYLSEVAMGGFERQFFLKGGNLVRRDFSSVVDLRKPFRFQKRRYRGLKKALDAGLKIEQTADFKRFWNDILAPNLSEKYQLIPTHSSEEIERLHRLFPDCIHFYGSYSGDELLAGTVIYKHPSCWHAQYIGISEKGKKHFASDLLYFRLMEEAISEEIRFFSFGVSQENEGKDTNLQLLEWKESWGAEAFSHDYYSFALE